jgi:hypothetical protein
MISIHVFIGAHRGVFLRLLDEFRNTASRPVRFGDGSTPLTIMMLGTLWAAMNVVGHKSGLGRLSAE